MVFTTFSSRIAVAWWALSGCVRALPDTLPEASPVSPCGAEAPVAPAAVSLREDPPLPDEPSDGWAGLAPPEGPPAADPHAHYHHPGMVMPGMVMPDDPPAADAGVAAPVAPNAGHVHAP